MRLFAGIANLHHRNLRVALDLFDQIQPDLIVAEMGITQGRFTRSQARRIEALQASIEYDFSYETGPKILLESTPIFNLANAYSDNRAAPMETRAALQYGLTYNIPVFLINEPFYSLRPNRFSPEVRDRGIIGFVNYPHPRYGICLVDFKRPKTKRPSRHWGIKARSLFEAAAINTLDRLFNPEIVASAGGNLHYHIPDGGDPDADMDPTHSREFTLDKLVKAEETRIYSAVDNRRIK
jgi:hypothetical protein